MANLNKKLFLSEKFLVITALILSLSIGVFAGFISGNFVQTQKRAPLEIIPQNNEKIPLIHFEKIENGVMYGSSGEKELRFLVGEDGIYLSKEGKFNFPVMAILPMLKSLPAPKGAQFVASKRGNRYWPLDAPEAFLLSEKNLIFFNSRQEAEQNGYKKGVE